VQVLRNCPEKAYGSPNFRIKKGEKLGDFFGKTRGGELNKGNKRKSFKQSEARDTGHQSSLAEKKGRRGL